MFHKRFMKEFRRNQSLAAGMVLAQWISLLANLALLWASSVYLKGILDGMAGAGMTIRYGIMWIIVLTVRAVMTAAGNSLSARTASVVKTGLRNKIFCKLMELGEERRKIISSSEAVQISTEGVEQLEIYYGRYLPQFFYSLLAPLTLFLIVSRMSLKTSAVLFLCVPLIPLSIVAVQKFAKKMLQKYWGTYTELGDSFLENLHGLTTLKIYQADELYAQKMDSEAEKFRRVTMRVLIMQLNSISVMDLVAYGGAAAGIVLGVLELAAGRINFTQSFFIVMVSVEFFLPLRLLGSYFHIAMNGNAAADKIFALLDAKTTETGGKNAVDGHGVSFDGITFGYEEGQKVLHQITFEVPQTGMTALVGTSGSGKSTIASLLMGEETDYEGKISLGNAEIRDIDRSCLYKKMTRVSHDSYLLKGTVRENLRMGCENAGESDMQEALARVGLSDEIMEKGGLDMELEEQAANLSGGQRQRLALARALLHDSEVYIFDEATSNIDMESENRIMDVILELARMKTVLLISHRLANVEQANRILVLKDGQICEMGTHELLMEKQGVYAEMYRCQSEYEKYSKEVKAWK